MTRLKAAAEARKRAEEDAARTFAEAVVAALRAGVRPGQVAEATGYSRETIRRIAREHDVPRLREPTVTSRRKADQS